MTSWISAFWARLRHVFGVRSASRIDPELREIFLSELDDVSDALATLLPKWRQHRTHPATLQELRRGFHTLKGSGLAIGATELGTFCGKIEKLVLMLIERPNHAASDAVTSIENAIGLLPACATALRSGSPMPAVVREIARSASKH